MLFKLQQAAELTGISAPTLYKWIDAGIVRPVVRGRGGAGGNGTRFNLQQLMGLSILAAKLRVGACCKNCMRRMMVEYEKGTEEEVLEYLQIHDSVRHGRTPWEEEEMSAIEKEEWLRDPDAARFAAIRDEIHDRIAAYVWSKKEEVSPPPHRGLEKPETRQRKRTGRS
jgi:hypothetical protein